MTTTAMMDIAAFGDIHLKMLVCYL